MAKPILTTFTDAEYERLDRVLADVHNTVEDNEVSTPSDLIRRAVLAYVDFYEKLAAGGLDHNPAVDLVLESVDGLRDISPPGRTLLGFPVVERDLSEDIPGLSASGREIGRMGVYVDE